MGWRERIYCGLSGPFLDGERTSNDLESMHVSFINVFGNFEYRMANNDTFDDTLSTTIRVNVNYR